MCFFPKPRDFQIESSAHRKYLLLLVKYNDHVMTKKHKMNLAVFSSEGRGRTICVDNNETNINNSVIIIIPTRNDNNESCTHEAVGAITRCEYFITKRRRFRNIRQLTITAHYGLRSILITG